MVMHKQTKASQNSKIYPVSSECIKNIFSQFLRKQEILDSMLTKYVKNSYYIFLGIAKLLGYS